MPTVAVNPSSNTTPDQGGTSAVTGASNTGHAATTSSASGANTQSKSCKWTGFPAGSGTITAVVLKVGWAQDGTLSDGGVSTASDFIIEYSLNGGSSWNSLHGASQITASTSGTDTANLSTGQNLTQVQVRDILTATSIVGESASVTGTVSAIRIEVTTSEGGQRLIVMM